MKKVERNFSQPIETEKTTAKLTALQEVFRILHDFDNTMLQNEKTAPKLKSRL